jgi:hypothetical protein
MIKKAAQGMTEKAVYQIGANCPIGEEVGLAVGLQEKFPDIPVYPVLWNALMEGLASRFPVLVEPKGAQE